MSDPSNSDSIDGFDRAPDRYMAEGREAVDVMRDRAHLAAQLLMGVEADYADFGALNERDVLADRLFAYACWTHAYKYTTRAGRKGDPVDDRRKADWWGQMASHVVYGAPDPRRDRPDFKSYERPPFSKRST